jgi:hypothetical protein
MNPFNNIALLLLGSLVCFCHVTQAYDIEKAEKLYVQIDKNDREARDDWLRSEAALHKLAKQRGSEITDQEMLDIFKTMGDIDTQNQIVLDQIVAECGWPTYEKWASTPVYAAVVISLYASTTPITEQAINKK